MPNEPVKLGETFSATKIQANGKPKIEPRHRIIGWGLISAILMGLVYFFIGGHTSLIPPVIQEKPSLIESLGTKIGGYVTLKQIRAGQVIGTWGPFKNTIVNEGETLLRDCFNNNAGTACTNIANIEFHGIGTSAAVIAETDGGCTTELTTQYNPDNTRATGTQTTNGVNVYRTVATNTVDAAATIEEFCLMDVAVGAGNMWTRILTGTITLAANDGLQTTYDLTIE